MVCMGTKKNIQEPHKRVHYEPTFPVEKGSFLGGLDSKLTSKQLALYKLYTDEFLTTRQVAIRLGISVRAVYKRVTILKRKGMFSDYDKKVHKIVPTLTPKQPTFPVENTRVPSETKVTSRGTSKLPMELSGNQIRLHGQEFRIDILFQSDKYESIRKHSNYIMIDGNTIRLSRKSIELYSKQSFFGDDVDKATFRSVEYFNRIFRRIENDLKIIILKPRKQNIKLVNSHYAEVGNELAEDCNNHKEKMRFYCNDDGKLWFLIDNSFNLNEAETVHPETSKDDMNSLKTFFDDIRQNPTTMSQVIDLIKSIGVQNLETAKGLNAVVQLLGINTNPAPAPADMSKPYYVG